MIGIYLVVAMVVLALFLSVNMFLKSSALKLVIITYTFLISSLVYFSFETYKGWPTADRADTGQVLWIQVIDPRGRDPGIIYFWVSGETRSITWIEKMYTYVSDLTEAPRAHWIPYSKKAASEFRQAQDAIQNGMVVTIEGQLKEEGRKGDGEGEGKAKGSADTGDSKVEDYDVPHLNIVSPDQMFQKG